MEEFLAAMVEQFEFMIDSEDNEVDAFSRIDAPGEHVFGFTMEDGSEFFVTVEPA